ncbi:50S ribosomal subunit protein L3 [Candidatus Hodgkinia cicadicola]|uniref:50S ribosomal protein L3 n=1 Tax=Candidatus Hodgkinia cicadicola TaxID=573658 RepID=A0ABX4MJB4_9HYPH|nr:50S ribosomal subunit protein L3 [Candidatus Hodgkinia cicadicola]PIM95964.1 50S ribosomal subunit protein L3 [Candidatus Hodgkinia cicadicola]PIM96192.1 50S ribosomal subunit protein L3 [Candidatus Hodgkinia cicadicola]
MKLVSVKSKMISINGNAATMLDILACVVVSSGLNFIKLGYNKRKLLKNFRDIDVKKIIYVPCFIKTPNEFGSVLDIKDLNTNSTINIRGKTKGRGFTGVIKRYGFSGLSASHGVSLTHRSLGAIGSRQDPGRVWKGKKMAGRMGNVYISLKLIKIVVINKFTCWIIVYGSVPGKNNNILYLQQTKT